MRGKYPTIGRYLAAKAQRAVLRTVIRQFAHWAPLPDAKPGYTILIGCNTPLAEMLGANLLLLANQNLTHCDKILIVFDRPAEQMPVPIENQMRRRFPALPLEFIFYRPLEAKVFSRIGWGWAYSWANWVKGIARSRTKYGFLHDFDAMLLRQDVIEERYQSLGQSGLHWCGIRHYEGNGLLRSDGLLTTFELLFDLQFLRNHFKPIDLFNQVTRFHGRSVDFDTFLYAQSRNGPGEVLDIAEKDFVHPTQVICQFTDLLNRPHYLPPAQNNLFFIPYFLDLAGSPQPMQTLTQRLRESRNRHVEFFGKSMDLSQLNSAHVDWIEKCMTRLETHLHGEMRPPVADFLAALRSGMTRQ